MLAIGVGNRCWQSVLAIGVGNRRSLDDGMHSAPPTLTAPVDETVGLTPVQGLVDVGTQIGDVLGPTFERTPWQGWALLLVGIAVGLVLARLVRWGAFGLAERTAARGREALALAVRSAARPASLACFTAAIGLGFQGLHLNPTISSLVGRIVAFLVVVALAWFLINLVALIEAWLRRLLSRRGRIHDQLVPLVGRTIRIFIGIVFVLFAAENIFNADITAWLAGLGIAGLAVSLAAQDSVKNVFGSITVLFDRPFVVGDRIAFGPVEGVVEHIGLRSTKIRTIAGHLHSVPNMKFTDGTVENITARQYMRRDFTLGLVWGTPVEDLRRGVEIVRRLLLDSDLSAPIDRAGSPPRVNFETFGTDSLNIRVIYVFRLTAVPPVRDVASFFDHAEAVNFRILEEFQAAGLEFAFPTRTVHLVGKDPTANPAAPHAQVPAT